MNTYISQYFIHTEELTTRYKLIPTLYRIPPYMRAINTFLILKFLARCKMSTERAMTRQTYERAPRLINWQLHTFQRVDINSRKYYSFN